MKVVPVRHCVECGKQHNSGIEDRMEGTFEPIDTCIDCLMGKCSFKFEKEQIILSEDFHNTTPDEMQTELSKTLIEILQKTYWNPPNEICDLPESEHGQTS